MTLPGVCGTWRSGLIVLTMALAVLAGGFHNPVSAHAVLVSSVPSQGDMLEISPAQIALRFSEAVGQVSVSLVDRDGSKTAPVLSLEGNQVIGVLAEPIADGVYALNWRAQSEDGHPVSGAVVFSVGVSAIPADFTSSASGSVPDWVTWAVKALFYVGCFFGVGGAFYAAWIGMREPGPSTLVFLLSGLVSGSALILLLGCETLDAATISVLDGASWQAGLRSSLGRCNMLAFLAIGLGLTARWSPRHGRAATAASLIVLGLAFALTGHASGAGLAWLSFIAVAVHVAAVTFWAGALPGLWRDLAPECAAGTAALLRFSSAIPVAVAVMLAAGLYLAFVQLGALRALVDTSYGLVLLGKLMLVASALALGAWNRVALTPSAGRSDSGAATAMRKVIIVEIILILAIAATTALWRFTPPPRALALAQPSTVSVHLHDATAMASLSFVTTGDLRFDAEITLTNGSFDPLDPKELKLTLAAEDEGVAPFEVELQRVGQGRWRADQALAPCNCRWHLRLDALVSDFDLVTLEGEARLLGGE